MRLAVVDSWCSSTEAWWPLRGGRLGQLVVAVQAAVVLTMYAEFRYFLSAVVPCPSRLLKHFPGLSRIVSLRIFLQERFDLSCESRAASCLHRDVSQLPELLPRRIHSLLSTCGGLFLVELACFACAELGHRSHHLTGAEDVEAAVFGRCIDSGLLVTIGRPGA